MSRESVVICLPEEHDGERAGGDLVRNTSCPHECRVDSRAFANDLVPTLAAESPLAKDTRIFYPCLTLTSGLVHALASGFGRSRLRRLMVVHHSRHCGDVGDLR
jgi:hypothetical protein